MERARMTDTNATQAGIDRVCVTALRCIDLVLDRLEQRHARDLNGHCGRRVCGRARRWRSAARTMERARDEA
jgi:hypothetical protein